MSMDNAGQSVMDIDPDSLEELLGDDIPIHKVGFFSRVGRFFRRLFGIKRKDFEDLGIEAYSKYKHFYEGISKEDPIFNSVRQAATLCDDALRVAKQRIRISTRLNTLDSQISELDAFINLTDDEITDLKRMLERFVALANERSVLLEKLTNYDSSLVDMVPLEEDAWLAIPSIKDAEKHQRALRMDIGYLTGEKEELIFERGDMNRSLQYIRRFTMGMIGVFFIAALILGYMYFNTALDLFIPATMLVLLMMGIITMLYFFRIRIRSEMRRNTRKQQRAIELLNKKSVVYAYYTNFLRFCYKKYKAKSSRTLENNLNDLESYRHLANRIDTVRSLMYETESGIERFLRKHKLGGVRATIEGFAKTVNLEDKRRHFNQLRTEKDSVEKALVELDKRHEEIWAILVQLNGDDRSGKVEQILETYMVDAEKLFTAKNNEEEKQEPKPIWKLFDLFAEGEGAEALTKTAAEILTNISAGEPDTPEFTPNSA